MPFFINTVFPVGKIDLTHYLLQSTNNHSTTCSFETLWADVSLQRPAEIIYLLVINKWLFLHFTSGFRVRSRSCPNLYCWPSFYMHSSAQPDVCWPVVPESPQGRARAKRLAARFLSGLWSCKSGIAVSWAWCKQPMSPLLKLSSFITFAWMRQTGHLLHSANYVTQGTGCWWTIATSNIKTALFASPEACCSIWSHHKMIELICNYSDFKDLPRDCILFFLKY